MSDRETAVRLALLKVLSEMLGETKTVAGEMVKKDWRPGDRLTAVLPDGVSVGTVSMSNGATTAKVADAERFEAWVRVNHPDAIVTATKTLVDPNYQDRLLSAARKLGEPIDAETGEVVPGIAVSAGDPYPSVKLTDNAREAVAAAWRRGTLTELVSGLLAIEGGEES